MAKNTRSTGKMTTIFFGFEKWRGFIFNQYMLFKFKQVKIRGVLKSFAFLHIFDTQRLLFKPFYRLGVLEQVNKIAFEQRLKRDHSFHLCRWKPAYDVSSMIGYFSDWHI
jgi:hypothetical protein